MSLERCMDHALSQFLYLRLTHVGAQFVEISGSNTLAQRWKDEYKSQLTVHLDTQVEPYYYLDFNTFVEYLTGCLHNHNHCSSG